MKIYSKIGQSILEYVLVLSAIVAVIAWAANGPIRNAVTHSMTDAQSAVENSSARLNAVP